MSTLVTAFMTNVNQIDFRSHEKYIELGKKLLSQPIPTVCFIEKMIFETYFASVRHLFPLTHFVFFEKEDNYLVSYESQLTHYFVHTDNPKKDTPGYMFVQCHKTEWVKMAIQENPFQTTNFIWVDFGIYHMIRDDMAFALYLENMSRKQYTELRIASCVDLSKPCVTDIFNTISWYFAGSVFGGDIQSLLLFADIMRQFCLELIENKKLIMWEVNIWYLIYKNIPSMFDTYKADHNVSILQNY